MSGRKGGSSIDRYGARAREIGEPIPTMLHHARRRQGVTRKRRGHRNSQRDGKP